MWGGGKSVSKCSKDYLSPFLTTKSSNIQWGEDFLKNFSVNMDSIYFSPEVDTTISFSIPTAENYDEEEDAYFITEFEITPQGQKKGILYESPVKLFINKKLLPMEKLKSNETDIIVNSVSFGPDEAVFKFPAKNTELTESLQEILDLIETSGHLGVSSYHELINKFDDLLIANDLGYINSVHIEMLVSVLIQDPKTGKRLDFSKDVLDPYEIVRVSKAVMNSPLAVSLSFERLSDQLIDLETYEKTDTSMMDALFK